MHYHRAAVIGHERSTWGVMEDNPTQDQIRANGSLLPLDFCINVTLNRHREITGFYCGDPITAHERGCEASKASVMVACEHDYPIVVTTNGGYPLDQNLYQAVKGMSAASQIVSDGGLIISVAPATTASRPRQLPATCSSNTTPQKRCWRPFYAPASPNTTSGRSSSSPTSAEARSPPQRDRPRVRPGRPPRTL